MQWYTGDIFRLSVALGTNNFPSKALDFNSSFFPSFSVNQRWSYVRVCLQRGCCCTSWDRLEPQVVWNLRQMKWCSWNLRLPANSTSHQRNGSVADLHLREALLPVITKQREGSLEIGCFSLKCEVTAVCLVQPCDLSTLRGLAWPLAMHKPQLWGSDHTDGKPSKCTQALKGWATWVCSPLRKDDREGIWSMAVNI